jgi:hypothetical protein
MTTDKIIAAARECGIDAKSDTLCRWDGWLEPLSRFYAIAYRAGMERAAEICEAQQDREEEARADARFKAALKDLDKKKCTERSAVDRGDHWMTVSTCNVVLRNASKAIRAEAHAKNQPESTHDTGNV